MALKVTYLEDLKVLKHQVPAYNLIPNTSVQHKPLLIYKSVFSNATASGIESLLYDMGVVTPQWRFTMYTTSHFHSTSHEVLAVTSGKATICFGHEDNPGKVTCDLEKGDLAVIPAGVAHRLLEVLEGDFSMVGSYPKGYNWDMCYGTHAEEEKIVKIKELPWFDRDPVYGDKGPVLDV
ncbi:RmlC-like cupin domain-containing protein [Xylaria longipes]|nr:RmlC-like cupin domain-containing protein [Xylaria longipes]